MASTDKIDKSTKTKKMTDKQKTARLANLERGRKIRMESVKQKKESKQAKDTEYNLSSDNSTQDESDSESDNGDFILSRKKKSVKQKTPKKQVSDNPKIQSNDKYLDLGKDVDELRNIVMELANIQKKQNKAVKNAKKQTSGSGKKTINNIVLPSGGQNSPAKLTNDSVMDALRRSLFQ